jgi:hypothetical protein
VSSSFSKKQYAKQKGTRNQTTALPEILAEKQIPVA